MVLCASDPDRVFIVLTSGEVLGGVGYRSGGSGHGIDDESRPVDPVSKLADDRIGRNTLRDTFGVTLES